jgi:phosphohistidine phosphatase
VTVPRRLTLLRHAQAFPARPGQHDFERPLDDVGLRQLRERAPAFASACRDFPVERCLYSPALRTTTTANAFGTAIGLARTDLVPEPMLYEIEGPAFLDLLRQTPDTIRHLLVVGHNPTLSEIAWRLSPGAPRAGLSPGDSHSVDFTGDWRELR